MHNSTIVHQKIFNFITKYHIPIIVSISIVLIIVVIYITVSYFTNKSYFPLKNENLITEVPNDDTNTFKIYLEDTLNYLGYNNITDATIRDNSVTTTSNYFSSDASSHTTSFLIDIDSIHQTYLVSITWYTPKIEHTDDTMTISCPKLSESKFPDTECSTPYNNSHNVDLWLPHEFTLDTGEKVIVKNSTIEQNGKNLQIYLYSCDDYNPPIDATAEIVKTWTKDTVKDPFADKYHYNVRYGYCSE